MSKTILLLLIAISFSSCHRIIYKFSGYKLMHLETPTTITDYAKKNNIPLEKVLYAKDSVGLEVITKFFSTNPGLAIINSKGNINMYSDKKATCPAPADIYIRTICNAVPVNVDEKNNESSLKALYKLDGTRFGSELANSVPRVYLEWAIYFHKNNKEKFLWANTIDSLKDCKYDIYWINSDHQGSIYGVAKRKKVKFNQKEN